jgi:glycosyltransferase involved in cell wall biosynthesis
MIRMAMSTKILIVVPCYNEGSRLQPARFSQCLAQNSRVGFLLVDDGSDDHTLEVLQEIQRLQPDRVDVLSLPDNCGKAEAVRRGVLACLQKADTEYVGFWDADLATPLDAIDDLMSVFEARPAVSMVFGARVKLVGRHIERRASRHYLGRVFATFASLSLRLPIYDTQCGAKIFRRTALLRSYFDEPFMTRWIFDVEILARALTAEAQGGKRAAEEWIYEYPLHEWCDVKGSKVRTRDFVLSAAELIRIRFKYRL